MFKPLDPLLHAELRLAVMSLLISAEEAEFPYIKEQTGATAGNLSVQIDKALGGRLHRGGKDLQGQEALHPLPHHARRTESLRGICGGTEELFGSIFQVIFQ